ncbi:MAG: hypothetical protein J6V16_05000, partial [Bacteroidales bacterium]|nr:hypothetical protein [Bacteroidales bacterium]
MKNYILCATMLFLTACGIAEQTENPVFRGLIVDEAETRVYLDDKVRLLWNQGDLITLFEGITRNKKYQF